MTPATERDLAGQRLLVVGASSGIGRSLAALAAKAGARVVATARRADRLDALCAEAGGQVIAHEGDARRDADCAAMVGRAVSEFGGLDAMIYAAGVSSLSPLLETDGEAWRSILGTNVIGPALTCQAALPHLLESNGRAVFLSSVSAADPRPMIVPYGASKAALDALIQGWRNEHPDIAFIRIGVGPTSTEFGSGWDRSNIAKLTEARARMGLLRVRRMTSDQCAKAILDTLTAPIWIEDIKLMPDNTRTEGDVDA